MTSEEINEIRKQLAANKEKLAAEKARAAADAPGVPPEVAATMPPELQQTLAVNPPEMAEAPAEEPPQKRGRGRPPKAAAPAPVDISPVLERLAAIEAAMAAMASIQKACEVMAVETTQSRGALDGMLTLLRDWLAASEVEGD